MSTTHFDTLRYVERLKAGGLTDEVARASADALNEAFSQAVDTALATRQDVSELRTEMKLEFADVRGELRLHRWMFGAIFAMTSAVFVRSFF